MSVPTETSYDVNVNHSVVFKCSTHDNLLSGTPTWWFGTYDDKAAWQVDTSDMWCDDANETDDCTDSWKITVFGTEVAS